MRVVGGGGGGFCRPDKGGRVKDGSSVFSQSGIQTCDFARIVKHYFPMGTAFLIVMNKDREGQIEEILSCGGERETERHLPVYNALTGKAKMRV